MHLGKEGRKRKKPQQPSSDFSQLPKRQTAGDGDPTFPLALPPKRISGLSSRRPRGEKRVTWTVLATDRPFLTFFKKCT